MVIDLWATGVTVFYGYAGSDRYGWAAEIHWYDNKFCEEKSVEGVIKTRYFEETMEKAIDTVMEIFEQFGLRKNNAILGRFQLYYKGDGEDKDYPPPKGWRRLLHEEAKRREWMSYLIDVDYEVVGGEE